MDKSELDFLQGCQKELAELKSRIAALEERISAIQEKAAEEPVSADEAPDGVDFTGLEIGVAAVAPAVEEPAPVFEEPAPEVPAEEDIPVEVEMAFEEPVVEPEPMPEPEPEPVAEEPVAAAAADDAPIVAEKKADAPQEASPAPAAPAPDTSNMPWRRDKPGLQVKNIRSGISLLDRAQFIGTLFKEDFALYDNTIAELNNMTSLDEAVAYIQAHFPQWNLGSEVAYRFMMAIRKKLG